MADSNEKIIESLKEYFVRLGKRNVDIANETGATRADISRLFKGKMGYAMAKRLHVTYGMSMGYLLSGCGTLFIEQTDEKDLPQITGEETEQQLDNIAQDIVHAARTDAQSILIDQLRAQVIAVNEENTQLKNSLAYAMHQVTCAHTEMQDIRKKIKKLLAIWSDSNGIPIEELEAVFNNKE